MPLLFTPSGGMTVGTEVELQILDATSLDLAAGSPAIFDRLGADPGRIKPELFQAMIEINTGICETVEEIAADLRREIGRLLPICDALGVALAGAGSHPFAVHADRLVYPAERYAALIDRNRWVMRRMQVFGLHVHVGMRDGDHAMQMINGILPWLPHVLALSASSPFWQGVDTGLASSRITIFEALPTAGHPCTFATWAEFEAFYDALIASRAITSIKDVWWDIRPHPDFGTVEVRVCDGLPTLGETVALVGVIHALFRWLDHQHAEGLRFSPPADWIVRENKWRASRWGLDAEIILDTKGRTALLRDDIARMLAATEPFAVGASGAAALLAAARIVEGGASYARQRRVRQERGSLEAVASALVEEFRRDAP